MLLRLLLRLILPKRAAEWAMTEIRKGQAPAQLDRAAFAVRQGWNVFGGPLSAHGL